MFQKRREAFLDHRGHPSAQITALTYDFPAGHTIPWHFHEWDQLVYASRGVMTIRTEQGAWVVPTHRAVWIPANMPHSIAMSGPVAMRTLYLKPKLARILPRQCCVINISPLLRELILDTCDLRVLKGTILDQRHLIQVILDQLRAIRTVPLQLPNPTDSRARRIAEVLLSDPSERRPLNQLCRTVGASKRTIERLFRSELGITVGKWRQQLRLMHAMRLLAGGAKVTHAALEAGYSTPSAFISMFGKALGTTPAAYFRPERKATRRR
ncbi:MAG TPA: helix-turn-helix transcriptional regulator [Candidatus Eremiobacteraceae bacterium]|nr:helix-turn-helix transcriptional regulator [Candidatus Eremiobacteraceae bacterium]